MSHSIKKRKTFATTTHVGIIHLVFLHVKFNFQDIFLDLIARLIPNLYSNKKYVNIYLCY